MSRKPTPEKLAQMEKEREDGLVRNLAERMEFLKGLPKRLKMAQDLAQSLGISVSTDLDEFGPVVTFYENNTDDKIYLDDKITYNSESWEMDSLEESLQNIKKKIDTRRAEIALAQSTFDQLPNNQQAALKKYIHLVDSPIPKSII